MAQKIDIQTDSSGKTVVVNNVTTTNISNSPTKLTSKGNSIYDLVEFEADGLITGEINPEKKDQSKYKEFEKNTLGATVIDKNKDLSANKTIINLYTSKPSNEKFNQVVDIEFTEFTTPVDSPLNFLESRLAALESTNAKTTADKAALNREIAQLRSQIDSLNEQLALAVDPGKNNIVSDTLSAGSELYSFLNGVNGMRVGNMLLSRNRMAKAVIQSDGNFVVRTGTYDYNGNSLGSEQFVWARGYDGQQDGPNRYMILKIMTGPNGRLETVRSDNNNYRQTWSIGDRNISPSARLQLTDSGILNLYDGASVIWSSYGS